MDINEPLPETAQVLETESEPADLEGIDLVDLAPVGIDTNELALASVASFQDKFDAMPDRALLLHIARELDAFKSLATEVMNAAESNPMARMFLGKLSKGGGFFGI